MPDMPEQTNDLLLIGSLESEKLLELHGIYSGFWLSRILLFDELAKASHLDQIKVLKFIPPGDERTCGNVTVEESQFELTPCLLTPLMVAWVPHDRVTPTFRMALGGGLSRLGKHQDVKAFPFVGTS